MHNSLLESIPGVTWYVSFKNQEYKIGEGENKLTIPEDINGEIVVRGEPYIPGNILSVHYKVQFLIQFQVFLENKAP